MKWNDVFGVVGFGYRGGWETGVERNWVFESEISCRKTHRYRPHLMHFLNLPLDVLLGGRSFDVFFGRIYGLR